MLTREEAYHRARQASEKLRDNVYKAANQLSADAITDADAKLRGASFNTEAKAARDAAYAAASDARAGAYAEAEQRHFDRLAAIQRHFGQQTISRGNPGHALAFVETVADPERRFAPAAVEATIGEVVAIDYNGIKCQVRIDACGRVVPRTRLQMTDGPAAGRSWPTPRPSWRPSAPALGESEARKSRRPTYPATADDLG
jgi:hypothetical protein